MPNLITPENHPPEVAFVEGSTPLRHLQEAERIFSEPDSPVQVVVWNRSPVGRMSEPEMCMSRLAMEFKIAGAQATHVTNTIKADITSPLQLDSSPDAKTPLVLAYAAAASELARKVDVRRTVNKLRATGVAHMRYIAHFDPARCVPADKREDSMSWRFMQGRDLRALWVEVNPQIPANESTSTLFWFPSDGDPVYNDGEFKRFMDEGDLDHAATLLGPWHFNSGRGKAWQLRNGDVAIFPDGEQWHARRYPLHSAYVECSPEQIGQERVLNRIFITP